MISGYLPMSTHNNLENELPDNPLLAELRDRIKAMAHRLKSPLSTLKLNLYLLQHQDDPQRTDRYVEVIEEQMALLAEMVDELARLGIADGDEADTRSMFPG